MKKKIAITTLALTTILASAASYKAHADVQNPSSTLPVYRLYNIHSGEHFYTTSSFEKNSLVVSGWGYEGTGWTAPSTGQAVYRLYNPNVTSGDHYYTESVYESNSLVKQGWKLDNQGKAVFYSGGHVNNYVAYNPNAKSGAHNYTTSLFEQNSLLNTGWTYGNIAWKVAGQGQSVNPMNIKQMLQGDYSSIQGTWRNSEGETLTFKGNKVTGSVDITQEGVKEVTLNAGKLYNNTVMAISEPKTHFDARIFLFAAKNTSPSDYKDNTDKTRDRLFIETNGGNAYFEEVTEKAFYRIN